MAEPKAPPLESGVPKLTLLPKAELSEPLKQFFAKEVNSPRGMHCSFASKCVRLSGTNARLPRVLIVSQGGVMYLMDEKKNIKETFGLKAEDITLHYDSLKGERNSSMIFYSSDKPGNNLVIDFPNTTDLKRFVHVVRACNGELTTKVNEDSESLFAQTKKSRTPKQIMSNAISGSPHKRVASASPRRTTNSGQDLGGDLRRQRSLSTVGKSVSMSVRGDKKKMMMEDEEDDDLLTYRVKRFYAKYCPEKAWKIPAAIAKAKRLDQGEKLLETLENTYGPEPGGHEVLDFKKFVWEKPDETQAPVNISQGELAPPDESEGLVPTLSEISSKQKVVDDPRTPSQLETKSEPTPQEETKAPLEVRLKRLYAKYCPESGYKIVAALEQAAHEGSESLLIQSFIAKYGPEPSPHEFVDLSQLVLTAPQETRENVEALPPHQEAEQTLTTKIDVPQSPEEENALFLDRVKRIYAKHAPHNAFKIPAAVDLAIRSGTQDEVIKQLVNCYGTEPEVEELVDISTLVWDPPNSTPVKPALEVPVDESTTIPDLSKSVPKKTQAYKVRVENFYRTYNPEKINEVDSVLAKHSGREDNLMAALEKKYGPEPLASSSKVQGKIASLVEPEARLKKTLKHTSQTRFQQVAKSSSSPSETQQRSESDANSKPVTPSLPPQHVSSGIALGGESLNQLRLCLRECAELNREIEEMEVQMNIYVPKSKSLTEEMREMRLKMVRTQQQNLATLVSVACLRNLQMRRDEEESKVRQQLDCLQRQIMRGVPDTENFESK